MPLPREGSRPSIEEVHSPARTLYLTASETIMRPPISEQSDARLLSPELAARELGISRRMIFKLLGTGEIRSLKIGRARRIPSEELERYILRGLEEAS